MATQSTKKKSKKSKKIKLSAEERKLRVLQRTHKNLARNTFRHSGFFRHTKLADKELTLDDTHCSDFDDIYTYENIIVCIEYTTSNSDKVGDHLRKKEVFYKHILDNPDVFFNKIGDIDSDLKVKVFDRYSYDEVVLKFVYCSRYDIPNNSKSNLAVDIAFLDYAELRYFKSLTDCIKNSARAEILDFLNIQYSQVGHDGQIQSNDGHSDFQATLLPETNSNFPKGYKIVSFYADAKSLIDRAYVLRRQGWRHSDNLYQRMISRSKIASIRKHLKKKDGRVFVNNIIATLDAQTKILNKENKQVDPADIQSIQHVKLQIPNKINSIGLIDGQHRTYSYYVSDPDDPKIDKLRKKQNLLVTGIVYPDKMSDRQKETFEARLFLEINSNQTNARSDLKQAINRIVVPFSDESIAYAVVEKLSKGNSPLGGHIVRHWFDTNKLKTTSVVSYGMKPLVKTSGDDSLFSKWSESRKDEMLDKEDDALLDQYINYCAEEINTFLIAFKKNLPSNLWTPDRHIKGRLVTTTVINSILISLRSIVENNQLSTLDVYDEKLQSLSPKDFEGFHSSQYNKLAGKIYKKYLKDI